MGATANWCSSCVIVMVAYCSENSSSIHPSLTNPSRTPLLQNALSQCLVVVFLLQFLFRFPSLAYRYCYCHFPPHDSSKHTARVIVIALYEKLGIDLY